MHALIDHELVFLIHQFEKIGQLAKAKGLASEHVRDQLRGFSGAIVMVFEALKSRLENAIVEECFHFC